MSRWVIAHLDAEASWAATGGPRRQPKVALLDRISALGSLLRVFIEDGDRLWTPRPVDPARCPLWPGLPDPVWVSGRWPARPPDAVLAWAETAELQAWAPPAASTEPARRPLELWSGLWHLPRPFWKAAQEAQHRLTAFRWAEARGWQLPDAGWITSLEALEHAAQALDPLKPWIAKAPWSAAGRDRIRGSGPLSPEQRRWAETFLKAQGGLLFEAWMTRSADYGLVAIQNGQETITYPAHRLFCSPQGAFEGLMIPLGDASAAPLAIASAIDEAARAVGVELSRRGYSGVFGIDAFTHAPDDQLHRLCEINARLTMGAVARAWIERLGLNQRFPAARTVDFRLGPALPDRPHWPLLLPSDVDHTAAWLEIPGGENPER